MTVISHDTDILLSNLILLNFLNSFLVELELEVNFFFVADVRLSGVLPNVLVNFSVLVLLNVMVDDNVLESVWEVRLGQPDTTSGS